MNYWLAILAAAFVLAGTGLWLLTLSVPGYVEASTAYRGGMWRQDSLPDIITCSDVGCAPYSEIKQRYQDFIVMDSTMFAAGVGISLFAWRKHKKLRTADT